MSNLIEKLKSPAFILAIAGSVKLIAGALGYNIPDQNVNEAVDVASWIVTLIGIYMNHSKGIVPAPVEPTKQEVPVASTPVDGSK